MFNYTLEIAFIRSNVYPDFPAIILWNNTLKRYVKQQTRGGHIFHLK